MNTIARIATRASRTADTECRLLWLAAFIWLDPIIIVDLDRDL